MENLINIGIILTYLMIAVGAITAIGFGVKKMIENPKNAKKTIYTIGGLIIVCLLSYMLASDQILVGYEKYQISGSTSKKVGMGLISFYVLAVSAIGIVLYTELSKVFSK